MLWTSLLQPAVISPMHDVAAHSVTHRGLLQPASILQAGEAALPSIVEVEDRLHQH